LRSETRVAAWRDSADRSEVVLGRARIDRIQSTLSLDLHTILLTDIELCLLVKFLVDVGRLVTCESLLKSVWSLDFYPGTNIVYTHIDNIRTHSLDHILESASGEEYRLNVE
jgi:DNA-binding response OmpR family regulator